MVFKITNCLSPLELHTFDKHFIKIDVSNYVKKFLIPIILLTNYDKFYYILTFSKTVLGDEGVLKCIDSVSFHDHIGRSRFDHK